MTETLGDKAESATLKAVTIADLCLDRLRKDLESGKFNDQTSYNTARAMGEAMQALGQGLEELRRAAKMPEEHQ